MAHTILYFGPFDLNFRVLGATTDSYVGTDGVRRAANEPSPRVEGMRFRYMEYHSKQFFAVGVEDLVLQQPVLLIPERHTDGKGFFSPPQFGDDSAMRLLVDMVLANPAYRDSLGMLIRRLP